MIDTKPLALVTGASSGIGLELAKQLAENGFDLIVNAEDAGLAAAAEQLRAAGAAVQAVQVDLRRYDGVEQLYAAITSAGRPLDAAALNAGVGQGGAFVDTDLADEINMIELNVTSTVHLAKRLLQDMVARDDGKVLITSSIASTMPGSFQAVYNATKSFLQSFAEALQNEVKDTNVTITSLMPGPTDTDFFARADLEDTKVGQASKDDPPRSPSRASTRSWTARGRSPPDRRRPRRRASPARCSRTSSRPPRTGRWPSPAQASRRRPFRRVIRR